MFWKSLSLRNKLLWLSLSGIAAIGLYFTLYSVSQEQTRLAGAQNKIETDSAIFGQRVADIFSDLYFDVQDLSANSVFLSESKEQISNTLNKFILNNKNYDSVLFVDSFGQFQAANGISSDGKPLQIKSLEGRNFSDAVWFQRAIKGEFTEDAAKGLTGSVVEDVHIDSLSSALYGTTQYGLGFSRAVYGLNGSILGVVTLRASLRPFEAELERQFKSMSSQGLESSHLYLMNASGLVVAEAASQERLSKFIKSNPNERTLRWNLATQQGQQAASEAIQGMSGSIIEIDRIDKNSRIWGFHSVKNEGFLEQLKWSVLVSAETNDIVSDVLAQRLWFLLALLVTTLSLGLINYGISRALTKEISDTIVKVKDESRSLVEFCENFSEGLRKAGQESVDRTSVIRKAIAHLESLAHLKDESRGFILQSNDHVRSLADQTAQSEQVMQRISVEISLAQRANDKFAALENEITEAIKSLSQLNEVVFKVQLISYNASIEAARAGIHGKGFLPVARELESLVEGIEILLKETLGSLNESKTTAVENATSVRRSLTDGTLLVDELMGKISSFKRDFDAVADGLEATRVAMESKGSTVSGVRESLHSIEESLVQNQSLMSDVAKLVESVGESGERIEDLNQILASSLKGGKTKLRSRRPAYSGGAGTTGVGKSTDSETKFVRSDVVDRLAQKMRPRLVVEAEPDEPEVNAEPGSSKDLKAG